MVLGLNSGPRLRLYRGAGIYTSWLTPASDVHRLTGVAFAARGHCRLCPGGGVIGAAREDNNSLKTDIMGAAGAVPGLRDVMPAMAELPEKKPASGTGELDQVQQDLLLTLKQTEAHLSAKSWAVAWV